MNNEIVEILRQKYMKDVPIGFTAGEIQRMSDDDIKELLDFSLSYRKNLAKLKDEGFKVGNKRVLKIY